MHTCVDWRGGEVRRLQTHFAVVLDELQAASAALGLDAARAARRNAMVAALERYAAAGVFPQNLDFPDRLMPYFVDAAGTRCAVGQLMDDSGAGDLVDRIVANDNHVRVLKLAGDARVVAWLDAVGLTLAEAARIQPSYCFTTIAQCVCAMSADTAAEVRVVGREGAEVRVQVVEVWGAPNVTAGDELRFEGAMSIGARALVRLGGDQVVGAMPIFGGDAEVGCMDGGPHRVPVTAITSGWFAEDCAATVHSLAPTTSQSVCDEPDEGVVDDGGVADEGCSGGAGGLVPGVLLLGWLRRRR